jgi:hypothetical protein
MPREAQSGGMGQAPASGMGDSAAADTSGKPGGGIGTPIDTPDPLTKYKWWILGGLALLLVAGAAFLLRKQGALAAGGGAARTPPQTVEFDTARSLPVAAQPQPATRPGVAPLADNASLLGILKEELFALEQEKVSGKISIAEYNETKTGLEAVLKRALKNQ